jgi:hypothetical protein
MYCLYVHLHIYVSFCSIVNYFIGRKLFKVFLKWNMSSIVCVCVCVFVSAPALSFKLQLGKSDIEIKS